MRSTVPEASPVERRVLDDGCGCVADADPARAERVGVDRVGDQAPVLLDGAAAGGQARVKEAAIGHARVVQVSEQRHEALAVECLEPRLHVAPLLALGLFGHDRWCCLCVLTRLSPSRPAAVRRDPLGALRSGDRQFQIQQSQLLTLSAASTDGDQFIRVAEIDLLDDHGLAQNGRTKWQREMLLEHGQEGGRLLGFAVGIHRRFLDQRVEPTRTRRP